MVVTVSEGVWCIDCQTLDQPNAFIVEDDELTLVDAGWPGDVATVERGLQAAGFEPADIDRVLLTHYDADHVGTLSKLAGLDAPLHIHGAEAPILAGEELPPWRARHGIEVLHRLYYRRLTLPDLPIRALDDGDTIGGFTAIHTPGHTPGHTAYIHEGLSAVFLGDLAYGLNDDLHASGWLTSFNTREVQESIHALLEHTLPHYVRVPRPRSGSQGRTRSPPGTPRRLNR
ncbi:MBL fold metallo-hydrolase [Halobacterium wangiae]|uniref:MBL fold metallo-hydrolase n=1 Tax=Halobacterium wangiae TaxID=2902623 RepID=UPI001E3E7740|nr:MBL fold metallo-hydrolase [Halobacterium wangiae]